MGRMLVDCSQSAAVDIERDCKEHERATQVDIDAGNPPAPHAACLF